MKKILFLSVILSSLFVAALCTSCSDDKDDNGKREYDSTLLGEWVEVGASNIYLIGYFCFNSDGTGISGTYEPDIDWINEDDDIKWYTVDDKYLYIDGARYEYWCDGSELQTKSSSGKTREYRTF